VISVERAFGGTPNAAWPDERLVSACIGGDAEAWSALIDKYKRLIFSIPIKLGLSRDDASEIFQQVCLGLLSELNNIRDPRSLPAWLIKVTTNQSIQWSRQQARFIGIREEQNIWEAETTNIEDHLRDSEKDQMVREALQEVRPRCRELIRMLFFESPPLSYQQTAQKLDIAIGSIGFIRMRCLQKLRKALEEKGFDAR
jgi:RNA polymerase sigma factor (sigma-70 family)